MGKRGKSGSGHYREKRREVEVETHIGAAMLRVGVLGLETECSTEVGLAETWETTRQGDRICRTLRKLLAQQSRSRVDSKGERKAIGHQAQVR